MTEESQSPKIIDKFESWGDVYRGSKPEELPWNAHGPDQDLRRLVESQQLTSGLAVDLGTGPGHDAVYLAQKGFRVIAVDIALGAVELAKSNARQAGVQGKIEFRVQDVLTLDVPTHSVSLIIDRGCFHTLAPDSRGPYIEIVREMLMTGKNLFLKTFSDKEPPGPGPHRFSRQELEKCFSPKFDFIEVRESIFDGKYKPKAYACLLEAKS